MKVLMLMTSFHTLVQSGSYAEAARALRISVHELERLVFDLECLLSSPLIHKAGNEACNLNLPVVPTDAGARWFFIIGELLRSSSGSKAFEGASASFVESLEKALACFARNDEFQFQQLALASFFFPVMMP